MKVFLQDAQTGLYYGQNATWVKDAADALDFLNVEMAVRHAFASDRDDLNVVLKYEVVNAQLLLNPAYCLRGSPPPPASSPP